MLPLKGKADFGNKSVVLLLKANHFFLKRGKKQNKTKPQEVRVLPHLGRVSGLHMKCNSPIYKTEVPLPLLPLWKVAQNCH